MLNEKQLAALQKGRDKRIKLNLEKRLAKLESKQTKKAVIEEKIEEEEEKESEPESLPTPPKLQRSKKVYGKSKGKKRVLTPPESSTQNQKLSLMKRLSRVQRRMWSL